MREIKFRGKRVENGEWVYGGVAFYNGDKPHIISGLYPIEITEESLGQFTGLKDKNGVEIYEGSVTNFGIVYFHFGCFCINGDSGYPVDLMDWNINKIEVIIKDEK